MEKQRTAIFLVLTVLGAGLLVYGLASTAAPVPSGEQSQVSSTSEPPAAEVAAPAEATQEVAQVAAAQEPPIQVQKKEAEPAKTPAACPT